MVDGVDDEVDRLLAKFAALAATDGDRLVFGASTHGYAFAPPLDADACATFEADAGVALPREYRAWLTRAGNGGAGPEYGLLPLAPYASDGFPAVESTVTTTDGQRFTAGTGVRPPLANVSSVGRPFLLSGRWLPSEPMPTLPPGANPYDGLVQLNEIGCGYVHLLVVHGERAGEVWWDYTAGDGELSPAGVTFFEWLERWLARSLVDASLREIRSAVEDGRGLRAEVLANEAVFLAAVDRSPEHPHALGSLGWFRMYQARFGEARVLFDRAALHTPADDVQAEVGRCVASRLARDARDVLETVRRARARSPRYVGYKRALLREESLAWAMLGDFVRALEVADQLLRDMPFVDRPHLDKAAIQQAAGDAAGAETTLTEAADKNTWLMLGEPGDAMRYRSDTPPAQRLQILRHAFVERGPLSRA